MMQQPWNEDIELDASVRKQCKNIKSLDLAVGVLCKNEEETILNVLNVVNEGLYRYFPDFKKGIIISKGSSTDDTGEAIDLFEPYSSVKKIVTNDITDGGKGAGIRTIFEIAHETNAKAAVLVDGDLLSIEPGWIRSISSPIIYGRADLTVPFYIRHKYDGVITNNLVYPFTRAVYGLTIRQPIAGEFGLSRNLYEILREHPLFPEGFGVDIFIVTVATAQEMMIKEGLFALKIHSSTKRYLEPEKMLVPMFRRVTSSMFELADYYEGFWKKRKVTSTKPQYREYFGKAPIPVRIRPQKLKKDFKNRYKEHKEIIEKILPDEIRLQLEEIVNQEKYFNPELWAKIVYQFTSSYKHAENQSEKNTIIEGLIPLWLGRFTSYANETKNMNINEAEKVIQKQAEVFENSFDYFKSIY